MSIGGTRPPRPPIGAGPAESQKDNPRALWVANTRQPEKEMSACRWAAPSFTGPNALRGTAAATP